jgi:hypothetical protein
MSTKGYLLATAVLFTAIALLHAVRLINGWPVSIDGWSADLWVSWVGLAVAGFLGWQGFRLSGK